MILARIYFVKEYTKFLALTLTFALALIFVLDLADVIRSGNNKTLLVTLTKSCRNIIQLMPLIILIGTIITFSSLSKKNELVIFSTLGLSSSFFIRVMIVIVTIIFILMIAIVIPCNRFLSLQVENNNRGIFEQLVFKTSQNTFISIGSLNCQRAENITAWALDNDFKVREVITADSGYMEKDLLILNKPNIEKKLSHEKLDKMEIAIDISPDAIANSTLKPDQVDLFAMPEFIFNLKKLGFTTEQYERYFYDKISLWINLLTMALLGFASSFSLVGRLAKKEKIFYGIAGGLAIFFTQDLIVTMLPFEIGTAVIVAKIIVAGVVYYST